MSERSDNQLRYHQGFSSYSVDSDMHGGRIGKTPATPADYPALLPPTELSARYSPTGAAVLTVAIDLGQQRPDGCQHKNLRRGVLPSHIHSSTKSWSLITLQIYLQQKILELYYPPQNPTKFACCSVELHTCRGRPPSGRKSLAPLPSPVARVLKEASLPSGVAQMQKMVRRYQVL